MVLLRLALSVRRNQQAYQSSFIRFGRWVVDSPLDEYLETFCIVVCFYLKSCVSFLRYEPLELQLVQPTDRNPASHLGPLPLHRQCTYASAYNLMQLRLCTFGGAAITFIWVTERKGRPMTLLQYHRYQPCLGTPILLVSHSMRRQPSIDGALGVGNPGTSIQAADVIVGTSVNKH